jgi:hypothetical protein
MTAVSQEDILEERSIVLLQHNVDPAGRIRIGIVALLKDGVSITWFTSARTRSLSRDQGKCTPIFATVRLPCILQLDVPTVRLVT